MEVALFFMNAFIFVVFFAPNRKALLAGELLCGKYNLLAVVLLVWSVLVYHTNETRSPI